MLGLPSHRAASRLRAVAAILARYGFDEFLARLDLPCRAPLCLYRKGRSLDVWERTRLALEDLGPTAVKIGQAVSTRPDLIPPELALALTGLQEEGRTERLEAVAEVAERSLGRFLPEVFEVFEETPLAAASLSQVHRARLKGSGLEVAVKIRRPGIRATILADLDLMAYMAGLAHQNVASLRKDKLPELVAETRKTILRELDFRNEARNILYYRDQNRDQETIGAPDVYPELAREEVLVMELIDGVRVDRFTGGPERGKALAQQGLAAMARQMLEHGFFHADPHFGNLRIVTRDGRDRLYLLDWGMVGRLTPLMRSALVDYLTAIVDRDAGKVAKVALDMAVKVPPLLDVPRFETDVMFVLERVWAPLERSANLGRFLLDLTTLCRSHDIHLRSDYVLMARSLISIEAAGRTLDPGFDVLGGLSTIAQEHAFRRLNFLFQDRSFLDDAQDNLRSLATMPARLARLADHVLAGEISATVETKDLDRLVDRLDRTTNRLASAIIVGSMVIGSSLVFISDIGPHWRGLPVFGLVGYLLCGLFAFWLIMVMIFHR